jgi:hypothetical protein
MASSSRISSAVRGLTTATKLMLGRRHGLCSSARSATTSHSISELRCIRQISRVKLTKIETSNRATSGFVRLNARVLAPRP